MKAAVYHGKEDIRISDVDTPTIGDGEILIKVHACAVCGTDMRTYNHGHKSIEPGRVLGHEFCGEIVENASNNPLAIGERVVMYIVMPCGECRYCQKGIDNMCMNRTTLSYHHDGAFAEYVAIPEKAVANNHLYKVPDAIHSDAAALCEPLGCVLNAHGRLQVTSDDQVVVLGSGPIGVMHALVAKVHGAKNVMLLDPSKERLDIAERFGFDHYIQVSSDKAHHDAVMKATDGFGADVVIVACSVAAAQSDALELAGKQGRVEFFGGLPKDKPMTTLDGNLIHYKELMITGSFSEKRIDFERAQDLIMTEKIPALDIITHSLDIDNLTDAFGMMTSGESLKVCIHPNGVI
ncbi:MAG: alcohol dehydrogenase catalytic domain-containing protein [Lentisphaeria bacterium]|nr:alcohol dehydrogenase catalytic domain-containing protein [Lentisphaeria bacterium]NQZ68617.1 alcohol dehydrogenase catalytic domain-containing protein [Lentisphaeria bacterium]